MLPARLAAQAGLADTYNNLGNALADQGKLVEAVASYRRAIELRPDLAEAHANLGIALRNQGKPDEATACHQRAIELKPDYAEPYNNLGNAFWNKGISAKRRPAIVERWS